MGRGLVLVVVGLAVGGCASGGSTADREVCAAQAEGLETLAGRVDRSGVRADEVLSVSDRAVSALIGWQREAESPALRDRLAGAADAVGAVNAEARRDPSGVVSGSLPAASTALSDLGEWCSAGEG